VKGCVQEEGACRLCPSSTNVAAVRDEVDLRYSFIIITFAWGCMVVVVNVLLVTSTLRMLWLGKAWTVVVEHGNVDCL